MREVEWFALYTRRQLAGIAFVAGLLAGMVTGMAACAPEESPNMYASPTTGEQQ